MNIRATSKANQSGTIALLPFRLQVKQEIFEINLGAFRQRMISSEMMNTISAALQKAKDSGLGTCDQHVAQTEPETLNHIAAPYSQRREC